MLQRRKGYDYCRRVHIVQKSVMCVCLSTVNVDRNGRINVKFGIVTFMEKLSINTKIVYNRSKISGTLREDQSRFYCYRLL